MTVEKEGNKQETAFSITRTRVHETGIVMAPAQGPPGTPAAPIRIHAPCETEVITWSATCAGGPPMVPSPYGVDQVIGLNDNMILMSEVIGNVIPVPIGGGTPGHIFVRTGEYQYMLKQPLGAVSDQPLGKMPWESDLEVNQNSIPKKFFVNGIIDPTDPNNPNPSLSNVVSKAP